MWCYQDPRNVQQGHYKTTAVACGLHHTLAIVDDGSLLAWGSGEHGILGFGDLTSKKIPTRCPAFDEKVVAANEGMKLRSIRAGEHW